jgi:hypothetical protein
MSFIDGQLFAFTGGKTSFTADSSELWLYWKKP